MTLVYWFPDAAMVFGCGLDRRFGVEYQIDN
jgi:hypothetical protein